MQPDVTLKLIQVNRDFYREFANSFSSTRQRLQPGVQRVIAGIPPEASLLDIGCGNGTLALELAESGLQGQYVGIDGSKALVDIAAGQKISRTTFIQRDLTEPDWASNLLYSPYDQIFCFATLHHIPGEKLRLQILEQVQGLLKPGGSFTLSNWQPRNSPKLSERIQPWARLGLRDEQVDPGDLLLDWRRDGQGLRYVHEYSEQELRSLAEKAGFMVNEVFSSDGETGDLGLYMIWRKISLTQ
jgi:tRNA (uracil-5-)-methyltransferase TRM9